MGRSGLIILVAVLIALFGFARHSPDSPASTSGQDPPAFGGSGSVTAHLKVVPTIRSVTVSPGSVDFRNCTEGTGDTASAGDQMGYPNGICWVGNTGSNGHFPVTVTYTGLAGNVWVSASGAVSDGNGAGWSLCDPTGKPVCTGDQRKVTATARLLRLTALEARSLRAGQRGARRPNSGRGGPACRPAGRRPPRCGLSQPVACRTADITFAWKAMPGHVLLMSGE